jgi:hypothetical protein
MHSGAGTVDTPSAPVDGSVHGSEHALHTLDTFQKSVGHGGMLHACDDAGFDAASHLD